MKKKLIIFCILISKFTYCQVGIGTKSPSQMIHIDAKQDNNRSDLSLNQKTSNDILISDESKVGIGFSDFITDSRFESKFTIDSGENGISGLKFSNLNSTQSEYEGIALPLGVTAASALENVDFPVGSVVPTANCIPDYYSARFKSNGEPLVVNPLYQYYNHEHDFVQNQGLIIIRE